MNVYNCIVDYYEKTDSKELYPQIPIERDSIEIESEKAPSEQEIKIQIQKSWARKGWSNLVIDAVLVPELMYSL